MRYSFLIIMLFGLTLTYSQEIKKDQKKSNGLNEAEIEKQLNQSFSDTRKIFKIIDSTRSFRGVVFGKDFTTVNKILQIQNFRTDTKMLNHKFGIINNNNFCKIDTLSLIGFADFIDNRLVQISFESMNEYRHVASYFVKYFGMPDQYNDGTIVWIGNNIKMVVTDSKIKSKSNSIGNATIDFILLH